MMYDLESIRRSRVSIVRDARAKRNIPIYFSSFFSQRISNRLSLFIQECFLSTAQCLDLYVGNLFLFLCVCIPLLVFNRNEVPAVHGLRKFCITQMAKANVDSEIAKLLTGHSIGVRGRYLNYSEDDLLQEHLRAVDLLTIN